MAGMPIKKESSGGVSPFPSPEHEHDGPAGSIPPAGPFSFHNDACAEKGASDSPIAGDSRFPEVDLFGSPLSHVHSQQTKEEELNNVWIHNGVVKPLSARQLAEMDKIEREFPTATAGEESFRHSGWKPNRDRVRAALESLDCTAKRLHRFNNCGSGAYFEQCVETGEIRLRANYCGDRFCVPCNAARSKVIQEKILKLMESGRHSMITFTERHRDLGCEASIDKLLASFAKLRARRLWKEAVKGGAFFVECKLSSTTNEWHVHLHVLARCKYIDWHDIRKAWLEITGDSHVVNVRAVDDKKPGALYASKYATKGFDQSVLNSPEHLKECIEALSGRRLVGTFGTWWRCALDDVIEDDRTWRVVGGFDAIRTAAEAGERDASLLMRRFLAMRFKGAAGESPVGPAG